MNGIFGWCLIVALVFSTAEIADLQVRKANLQVAESQRLRANIPAAEAWMQAALQTAQEEGGPSLTNPFTSGTTINGIAVSAALVGQTGSGSLTSFNLDTDPNAGERRVAVDVTLAGAHGVKIVQRFFARLVNGAPFVQILSEHRLGGDATTSTSGVASDTGGCNSATSTGCDPLATSAQDDSRYTGFYNCVNGVGSGTCAPGQTFVHPTYGNAALTNNQTSSGGAPQ